MFEVPIGYEVGWSSMYVKAREIHLAFVCIQITAEVLGMCGAGREEG